MSRGQKLVVNSIIMGIGTVLPKMATFVVLPILTAFLTKNEYGQYDLILTSMSLILPFFSLLIEQAVFRMLLESDLNSKSEIITNSSMYILVASSILFIISQFVLFHFEFTLRILISLYLVLNLCYSYVLQVCRGLGYIKRYSISSIVNTIVSLLLIVLFVKLVNLGLIGLMYANTISVFLALGYILYTVKEIRCINLNNINIKTLKQMFLYSIPLLPNSVSWWVIGVSDRWIISMMLGIEMTAIYAVSTKIPSMFNIIYNSFNLAWQESAAVTLKDSDVSDYYSKVFNFVFNFLVGLLLLLFSISPMLFNSLIDESYCSAFYQMPILFIAMFFNSIAAYYGGIYVAFKNTKNIGFSSFIAALLNVILNFMLISKFGLFAASFSTLFAYLALTVYRGINLRKHVNIRYNWRTIFLSVMAILFSAGASYSSSYYFKGINLVFSICVAVILNRSFITKIVEKFKYPFKSSI